MRLAASGSRRSRRYFCLGDGLVQVPEGLPVVHGGRQGALEVRQAGGIQGAAGLLGEAEGVALLPDEAHGREHAEQYAQGLGLGAGGLRQLRQWPGAGHQRLQQAHRAARHERLGAQEVADGPVLVVRLGGARRGRAGREELLAVPPEQVAGLPLPLHRSARADGLGQLRGHPPPLQRLAHTGGETGLAQEGTGGRERVPPPLLQPDEAEPHQRLDDGARAPHGAADALGERLQGHRRGGALVREVLEHAEREGAQERRGLIARVTGPEVELLDERCLGRRGGGLRQGWLLVGGGARVWRRWAQAFTWGEGPGASRRRRAPRRRPPRPGASSSGPGTGAPSRARPRAPPPWR